MKYIPLTKGFQAMVDDEDYERLSKYRWCANVGFNYVRAMRVTSLRRTVYIHHEVLNTMPWTLDGKEVDHIDRNPLNNQKENLRIVSHSVNILNKRPKRGRHQ